MRTDQLFSRGPVMRRLAALCLLMLLGACTTPIVQADVTRFNAFGPGPNAATFTIEPEQGQVGSLEFQDYASQVANALAAQGWRPVAPGGGASATRVQLSWGLGPANTVTWQSPTSVYGGYGWGPYGHSYGAGMGWYDPFPYWETRSATYWPKWLSVRILEARGGRVLFEGRAVAEGTRREIAPVMPYLIRALFTGFPGANGSTVRVQVPIQQ